jgi:uncharacterized membrane protein
MSDQLQLLWQPLLPVWLLAGLGIAAIGLVIWAMAQQARGVWWRLGLLTLLLLALANPSLVAEQRAVQPDTALLVLDQSPSMSLGERIAQRERALTALKDKIAKLRDVNVETVTTTGTGASNLFAAMRQKLADIPTSRLAAVIMITDGEVHDAPPELTGLNAPLHVLLAGRKDEIDRRIRIVQSPAYGLTGKDVPITINVTDYPRPQSTNAELTLQLGDGSSRVLTVPVGQDVPLNLPLAKPGNNLFVLTTAPLPGELTTLNNSAALSINGIRDRLRVLLVSGEPHPGERVWRNFLKADPAVDLVHFTILRSPDKFDGIPNSELALIPFPVQELFVDKLDSFDLIILDRFHRTELVPPDYLTNIARYVEQGGALLLSESSSDDVPDRLTETAIGTILPAAPTGDPYASRILIGGFVPTLSDFGTRHPITNALPRNQDKPWGHWLRMMEGTAKPDGTVLMTGLNNRPLLVVAHVGKGRVAHFLSDQFWLWARNYDGGGPQGELLRRTAHWLMREPDLDETALTARVLPADTNWDIKIALRSLTAADQTVMLTGPDGQTQNIVVKQGTQPGLLEASVMVAQTGLYRLRHEEREIIVMAGVSDAAEYGAMHATGDILKLLVERSGGGLAWLQDQPDGPALRRTARDAAQTGWGDWFGLQRNDSSRVTGSTAYPLWPAWLLLTLLLATAMLGWRREGSG